MKSTIIYGITIKLIFTLVYPLGVLSMNRICPLSISKTMEVIVKGPYISFFGIVVM